MTIKRFVDPGLAGDCLSSPGRDTIQLMSPKPEIVLAQLAGIQAELHHLGWWQLEPLGPEQYHFSKAFAMDTMSYSQWLQFIFIPRVKQAAAEGHFPPKSQVGAQAVREFDGLPEAAHLVHLLSEFDALF